jgi:hypothetical protein
VRIAVLVALGCGCGITVAGSLLPDGPAGGTDGGAESGATLPEGGPDGTAVDDGGGTAIDIAPLDASFDANPLNCETACVGGTCDGGWCTPCAGAQCKNALVVCPPGVPCALTCNAGECNAGVDCSGATACDVRCIGNGSCTNGPVTCSGAACTLKCSGQGSCNKVVACDAGSCAIGCTGQDSCKNSTVDCQAASCQVVCGSGSNNTGHGSCAQGVTCTSAGSCDITCQDQDTCENHRIEAVAGGAAVVRCTGASSCNKGIFVSAGTGDAICRNTSCGPGITCDGGACTGRCNGTDIGFCCKATSCSKSTSNCSLSNTCP